MSRTDHHGKRSQYPEWNESTDGWWKSRTNANRYYSGNFDYADRADRRTARQAVRQGVELPYVRKVSRGARQRFWWHY
jgi:hypothetical protein